MKPVDFVRDVWSEQGKGWGFICLKTGPTNWRDIAYKVPDELDRVRVPNPGEGDVYFTPNLFSRPRRNKELMLESCFLYADLDQVDPWSIDDEWEPSIAWESSPGRFQALWRVGQHLTPDTHAFINRRLTYMLKADRGGWDSTQVLRVPGTVNHKYPERPQVKLLWFTTDRQTRDWKKVLDHKMPAVPKFTAKRIDKRKLPAGIRAKLGAKSANGDRSRVLWRLERQLLQLGYTEGQVYLLVKPTVWNKFAPDDDRLRQEITRAAGTR